MAIPIVDQLAHIIGSIFRMRPSILLQHMAVMIGHCATYVKAALLRISRGFKDEELPNLPHTAPAAKREKLIGAVEDFPRGYPRLSAFQSSDGAFAIFRKFGTLRARCLLLAQAELESLERQLNAVDTEERVQLYLSSCAYDGNERRRSLLETIRAKLEAYDAELFRFVQVLALNDPRPRDIASFRRWMSAVKPLVAQESVFPLLTDDLVSLKRSDEAGLLEEGIERLVVKTGIGRRFLQTDRERQKTSDIDLHYFSVLRQGLLVRILHTFAASCLLITPTLLLYLVKNQSARLFIVTISTIAFATTVAVFTRAKRHEIFTSTATYAAVLVIFIGTVPGLS